MSLLMHNHYKSSRPLGQSHDKTLLFVLSFALIGSATPTSAQADQQFYRCVKNGKTTYTDKPCDAPTLPGMEAPGASRSRRSGGQTGKPANSIELDYTTPYGIWRGQAQYQATVKGQTVSEAHVVVPLVIQVEKEGRVRGASPENGCRMLGVAAPYVTPNLLTLDVTLSDCRYPALNRRYSGTLALYRSSNSVQFYLHSFNIGLAAVGDTAHFDIKATMRRQAGS
ncbi:MAG: DUF4124 domain-containing protein [Thiobacillaceae bacterium]